MLHAVGKLRQNLAGDVVRRLGDEVHAHAFGADELDDLDDLAEQLGRHVLKQQVRLVEKEDEIGLVEVAHFGELLEEVGEHPQK